MPTTTQQHDNMTEGASSSFSTQQQSKGGDRRPADLRYKRPPGCGFRHTKKYKFISNGEYIVLRAKFDII